MGCVTSPNQSVLLDPSQDKSLVQIKSHRHRAVSVFRRGLDHLQDLLLHPSPSSWHTLE